MPMAYTGAISQRVGRFELAHRATIFFRPGIRLFGDPSWD
jgi:hypothetical protein